MIDFDKRFRRHQRFVNGIILTTFVIITVSFGAMFYLGFKAVDAISAEDWSGGIKPFIEKMWCGSAGCFDENDNTDK